MLEYTLDTFPSIVISVDHHYSSNGGEIRLLFWMEGVARTDFENAVAIDPTVRDLEHLCELGSRQFYRVNFTDAGRDVSTVPSWYSDDIVPLEATGTHDGWLIRLGVPDRETVVDYRGQYVDSGCSFVLLSLYDRTDSASAGDASLTDAQRTAIVQAYESGFFAIPREITQADLAKRLEISAQALSERLRRATVTLIETALRRK